MNRPVLRGLYVTRPALEAKAWVDALVAAGWPARELPLIETAAPSDPAALAAREAARQRSSTYDALMFVSGAAVTHFFQGLAPQPWRVGTRFWAPGPATGRRLQDALVSQGVPADRIDMPAADSDNFDSESLWPVVSPMVRPGTRILIVRGLSQGADPTSQGDIPGQGRGWLIERCRDAGAHVDGCAAYERRAPAWTDAGLQLVREGVGAGRAWLFSSSEALDHLARVPGTPDWRLACAMATHPRIAALAHRIGFGSVVTLRPTLPDLLAALESGWSRP
ncbi:MAG: uroporphyrinogen-III synthase [Gammaproteobacteria bacterium]